MALTALQVKNAKLREKRYKLFDQGGLYLEVSPTGRKWWRYKYRISGREHRMSLGTWPKVSLAKARLAHSEARDWVDQGLDPLEQKEEGAAGGGAPSDKRFETVAREWYRHASRDKGQKYGLNLSRLETYLFPYLGQKDIDEITPQELMDCLNRIVELGLVPTAHKARGTCNQAFKYAIRMQKCSNNPAAALRGELPSIKKRHFAAVTEPEELGKLLAKIWNYQGRNIIVGLALRALAYTFVRPSNIREMEWGEIRFARNEWIIPGPKLKGGEDEDDNHIVPLSRQMVEILEILKPLTGDRRWVFPGANLKKPLSENTLNKALHKMGVDTQKEHTSHGWRASARTILDEVLEWPPEVIEQQLAHEVPDMLGRAYNRTRYIKQRKQMMQQYADYLDSLRMRSTSG